MKRSILALLLFFHSVSPFLHDWACGNEHMYWTQRVAWWIAKPAGDKPYINRCCQIHDEVMVQWEKSPSVDLEKSDDEFALCLKKSKFL
ncbi:hypothetical protein CAEBREN_02447 [Caenorhabditis brenneri]|uniref:Uncharacterized protein n=1 Tax=Caenorhabditis brenneri TaxID=135651 RepID=G0MI43_CAEBE|nr:hypothetical protein CAEBREN_02447 [Caenorhabditis brenneri]